MGLCIPHALLPLYVRPRFFVFDSQIQNYVRLPIEEKRITVVRTRAFYSMKFFSSTLISDQGQHSFLFLHLSIFLTLKKTCSLGF